MNHNQRWKLRHGSGERGDGNRNPSLKGLALLRDCLAVSRKAFQVQGDGFFDVPFRLFQGLALSMATGQRWHDRHTTALGSLLVENRIGEGPGGLVLHNSDCKDLP